ncbi:helix-turn-helix transcriptional regulator [bacterium 210820-DFI.6.37]|nr:helix-turn-helix transcriptional regulator [bacterium 210820-DFI.6.37]
MHLSESDWLFINSIAYKIHATEDFDKMRLGFLNSIKLSIDYRCASFYLADKTRPRGLCDPIGVNFTQEQLRQYIQQFESLDYLKTVTTSLSSYVYRETDLFSPEDREASLYYRLAYKPLNIHYALLLGLVFQQEFLGSIVFYRAREDGDFSDSDIFKLELLKDHMALRLAQEMGLCGFGAPRKSQNKSLSLLCTEKGLTDREKEVIAHLYRGDTTAEICDELCIAQTTLKKHITNAYKKLGIGCRSQLYKISNAEYL